MEAFKVFATLSLIDLMSGPLAKMQNSMKGVEGAALSLGQRFGNLAVSMAPVALAAGAVLGAFGKCVATAAGFEDQMAKVGAISMASASDLQALENKARELGATTQFTASEVARAEQYLAMAGFKTHENIAALPGVLNLAAATATDLGRAADISSDILGAFGMKAEDMGRCADVLAKTCSTANTNMELLGDTMKYVAISVQNTELSIRNLNKVLDNFSFDGIKGSEEGVPLQAGTTLKAMLNKLAAPAGEGAKALAKLGIATKDAAGNLRSPIRILGEMSGKLKQLGTAEQMAAMKAIVGEEAVAGFAEMIEQGGIGKIEEYIRELQDCGGACDEMARRMNDTLAGDVRGLGSAFESVQITIGKLFIPIMRKVVQGITGIVRRFDKFARHPVGKFLIKLASVLAAVALGITAISSAMWGLSALGGLTGKVLLPLKAAILGVGGPMLAIIGICTLLYAAWKTNFGGIVDVMSRWRNNIRLVVNGVIAVFQTLKGSTGEIRGELAKEIKAAGLEKFVTAVAKTVYRIKEFFGGVWESLDFGKVAKAFEPAMNKIKKIFDIIGDAFSKVFGTQINGAASEARSFGRIIGGALTWSLEALGTVINAVANGISIFVDIIRFICAIFTGEWDSAASFAKDVWNTLLDTLMSFGDLFGIGDRLRDAWDTACKWLDNIVNSFLEFGANILAAITGAWDAIISSVGNFGAGLLSGITGAWEAVIAFFDGLNLFESGAKLLSTFIDGIMSMAGAVVDSVKGCFAKVREFLPFSDAHEGPFSQLTLSGGRLMTTLAEGVKSREGSFANTISGALGKAGNAVAGFFGIENRTLDIARSLPVGKPVSIDVPQVETPNLAIPEAPTVAPEDTVHDKGRNEGEAKNGKSGQTINITIQNLKLPDVTDAQDFVKNLQAVFQAEIGSLEGIA